MIKVSLEAPWFTFNKKVKALFERDPDIVVSDVFTPENDEIDYAFSIEVKNHKKFVALDRVMPHQVNFGATVLGIDLFDEENINVHPGVELFNTIFEGNPIMKDLKVTRDQFETDHVFVRFQPEVIQFPDDDLTDYNGNWNGLAEDIARDVFVNPCWNVNFCTAPKNEEEDEQ